LPNWLIVPIGAAWLLIIYNIVSLLFPRARLLRWLNRPMRAWMASRRFHVPYRSAYLLFREADRHVRGEIDAEEMKRALEAHQQVFLRSMFLRNQRRGE
jgi:hypothetical protein